jgi:hypothetical protein
MCLQNAGIYFANKNLNSVRYIFFIFSIKFKFKSTYSFIMESKFQTLNIFDNSLLSLNQNAQTINPVNQPKYALQQIDLGFSYFS